MFGHKLWDLYYQFLENWDKRVQSGEVSSLSGVERATIRIFLEWLEDNARVEIKQKGGEIK